MATDIEAERHAWGRLVRVLSQIATAADIVNVDDAEEREGAENDLRQLAPDVDDYLAPKPEHCGQCGAEIQGHHGYCEIVADDDPPPSGE